MSEQNRLPKGWAYAKVSELARYVTSGARDWSKYYSDRGPLFIRTEDINTNRLVLTRTARMSLPPDVHPIRTRIEQGDILITVTGANVGKCAYIEHPIEEAYPSQSVALVKLKDIALSPYLHKCIIAPGFGKSQLDNMVYGLGRPVLNLDNIRNLYLPIAPLNEQRRIVAKMEELFSDLDAGVATLERIRANLKRYRAAVLKAAVEGKLTEEWRAKHPNTEPASKLLERMLAERRKKWEEDQLAKFAAANKTPPKGWREKYAEPAAPDTSQLPELPQGWCWVTWEMLLAHEDGAFKRGPFGSTLKKSIFVQHGYKVYEQYCPINDDCSFGRYYITEDKFRELESFAVKPKDFLISCSGVTLGRITQVPDDCEQGIINQALLRVRLNDRCIADKYFVHVFRSPFLQQMIFDNSTGSAIPNVKGVKELKGIAFPLPPFTEQSEVVAEIERQFSLIEETEAQVNANLKRATRLRQSILKRAFEGRLVPQDPTDEPADKLLERIRQERTERNGSVVPRTRRGRAASRQAEG